MSYYVMKDGIEFQLYKANEIVHMKDHLYKVYARVTESGILTSTGQAVLLVNDNEILTFNEYRDNIYKKESNWFGFNTKYVKVTPTGTID